MQEEGEKVQGRERERKQRERESRERERERETKKIRLPSLSVWKDLQFHTSGFYFYISILLFFVFNNLELFKK